MIRKEYSFKGFFFDEKENEDKFFKDKKKDFDLLLSKFSFEELVSNFIFTPQYFTEKKRFYWGIIDLFDSKKRSRYSSYKFRSVASFKNILAPNENALFHLFYTVLSGAFFLSKSNFCLNSLSLDSIFHLGTKKDFLLSDYSFCPKGYKLGKFRDVLQVFINDFLKLYKNYILFIGTHNLFLQEDLLKKEKKSFELQEAYFASDEQYFKDQITNMQKIINQKQENFLKSKEYYKACLTHPFIEALQEKFQNLLADESLSPKIAFNFYQESLKELAK